MKARRGKCRVRYRCRRCDFTRCRCGRRWWRVRARPLWRRGSARWLRRVRIRANATHQRGRRIVTAAQGSAQILSWWHLSSGGKAVGCNKTCMIRAVETAWAMDGCIFQITCTQTHLFVCWRDINELSPPDELPRGSVILMSSGVDAFQRAFKSRADGDTVDRSLNCQPLRIQASY